MQLTRMLLAVCGRERRPRCFPASRWKWAKAWARRWWLVEAGCAKEARMLIARACGQQIHSKVDPPGRIVDCGRNARGGPEKPPTLAAAAQRS